MRKIKIAISWNWPAPQEYIDYILIKELYHCTPKELDEQDEYILRLHTEIIILERKQKFLENKRLEQKNGK